MKLSVSFEENSSIMNASLSEGDKTFAGEFGELTAVTERGATFIPTVSDEGIISWENDRDLENPAPVNIKGPAGKDGATGPHGPRGETGATGATGPAGKDGSNGVDGKDGYSPVRGKDYWTEADKAEIVSAVLAALPVYAGEVADV